MGQYSQWLYHREINHQLRERLELLAQELHTLQEQAALLKDAAACTDNTDNPIIQSIAMQQSAGALLENTSPIPPIQKHSSIPVDKMQQPSKSVSPALFAWSNLPNLDTQKMPLPATELDNQVTEAIRKPSIPHSEVNLLPNDMAAFIEAHEQTLPQIQIPNWLRQAALNTNTTSKELSGADERTNISIQRWLERWGKQVPNSTQQE